MPHETHIIHGSGGSDGAQRAIREGMKNLVDHIAQRLRSCASDTAFLSEGVRQVLAAYDEVHGKSDEVDCEALAGISMAVAFKQAALFAEEVLSRLDLQVTFRATGGDPAGRHKP